MYGCVSLVLNSPLNTMHTKYFAIDMHLNHKIWWSVVNDAIYLHLNQPKENLMRFQCTQNQSRSMPYRLSWQFIAKAICLNITCKTNCYPDCRSIDGTLFTVGHWFTINNRKCLTFHGLHFESILQLLRTWYRYHCCTQITSIINIASLHLNST